MVDIIFAVGVILLASGLVAASTHVLGAPMDDKQSHDDWREKL